MLARVFHLLIALTVISTDGRCSIDAAERPGAKADAPNGLATDVVINPSRTSYDTTPAMCLLPDGSSWAIWKSYFRSKERVLARHIAAGRQPELGPVIELSDHPGVVDGPQIIGGKLGVWAFWSSRDDRRWRIIGRPLIDGRWRPTQILSAPNTDAIRPQAIVRENGQVVLVWSAFASGPSQVWMKVSDGRNWGDPVPVSDGRHQAYRPVLAEFSDQVWAVWDEYLGIDYVVKARPMLPQPGPIAQVSPEGPAGRRCLTPVVVSSAKQGLCVAWLKLTDISGGDGIIDQLHTLQMAIRRDGSWQLVRDEKGDGEAAHLVYGLLSDIRSGGGYPSGYVGRRRHPLLVDDGEAVWLLWEQKAKHTGSGLETTGNLLARGCRDGRWQSTVMMYQGLMDYRLVQPARASGGRFLMLGSDLPINWTRAYHRVSVNTADAKGFTPERWDDAFRPIKLPLESESPRHRITVDGKMYRLYWADMHCHSGLTSDAEGEPDEIINYGRDRAQLDMMVLQDNDELYNCFLTESEYWLGALHSQKLTESGQFLALPGYEWTQRMAKSGVPFNPFIPVYGQRGTFPNHRTIIYPPAGGPIIRYPEVGGSFERLCDEVEKAGGIMNTQHRTFVPVNRKCETNMEVCSGWEIYIHAVPEQFHGVLNTGHRLGFVGCSDSHRRNPGLCGGLTGIYAESLAPDDIIDALRKHRCFATNGSKIIVDTRANGRPIGEEVNITSGRVELTLNVIGTRPVVSATLVRGGKTIKTFKGDGTNKLRVVFEEDGLSKGEHWYYWKIAQEGSSKHYRGNTCVARGNLAWSSPHWIISR